MGSIRTSSTSRKFGWRGGCYGHLLCIDSGLLATGSQEVVWPRIFLDPRSPLGTGKRYLAAARVGNKLTGPAKGVVRNRSPEAFAALDDIDRLLDVLRAKLLQKIPILGSFSRREVVEPVVEAPGERAADDCSRGGALHGAPGITPEGTINGYHDIRVGRLDLEKTEQKSDCSGSKGSPSNRGRERTERGRLVPTSQCYGGFRRRTRSTAGAFDHPWYGDGGFPGWVL